LHPISLRKFRVASMLYNIDILSDIGTNSTDGNPVEFVRRPQLFFYLKVVFFNLVVNLLIIWLRVLPYKPPGWHRLPIHNITAPPISICVFLHLGIVLHCGTRSLRVLRLTFHGGAVNLSMAAPPFFANNSQISMICFFCAV
jgi:hypothetical protein